MARESLSRQGDPRKIKKPEARQLDKYNIFNREKPHITYLEYNILCYVMARYMFTR